MNLIYYLSIFLLSILFNALPAFAPSTWMVIAYFDITHHLPYPIVLAIAILGSSLGRIILAKSTGFIVSKVNNFQINRNMDFFKKINNNFKYGGPLIFSIIFFAFPTPSNWLFMAIGKNNKLLAQVTIGHALGRIINYTMAVFLARASLEKASELLSAGIFSLQNIILELFGLIFLLVTIFVDWESLIIERKFRFNVKKNKHNNN